MRQVCDQLGLGIGQTEQGARAVPKKEGDTELTSRQLRETKLIYSVRQYSNAKKACSLQDIIGRPSTQDFIKYVEGNMIPNCNITRQDLLRFEDIFGPNLRISEG